MAVGSCVLLDTVPRVTAELALDLLREAEIPALLRGPDFDVAELGVFAHDTLRGVSVHVPASSIGRACSVLDAAWGEQWREREASPAVRSGIVPAVHATEGASLGESSPSTRTPWYAVLAYAVLAPIEAFLEATVPPLLDLLFGRGKKDRRP